jgi:hypothetical protein
MDGPAVYSRYNLVMEAIRVHRHLESQVVDLPELAPLVGPDVEIIVIASPVASSAPKLGPVQRRAGSAKGTIELSADFDAPLDDFAEYMP